MDEGFSPSFVGSRIVSVVYFGRGFLDPIDRGRISGTLLLVNKNSPIYFKMDRISFDCAVFGVCVTCLFVFTSIE